MHLQVFVWNIIHFLISTDCTPVECYRWITEWVCSSAVYIAAHITLSLNVRGIHYLCSAQSQACTENWNPALPLACSEHLRNSSCIDQFNLHPSHYELITQSIQNDQNEDKHMMIREHNELIENGRRHACILQRDVECRAGAKFPNWEDQKSMFRRSSPPSLLYYPSSNTHQSSGLGSPWFESLSWRPSITSPAVVKGFTNGMT